MRGVLAIPPETLANQAKAANPDWSIWVEANAGSGKTHVLTQRVLRLLLANVAPQSILCLTYTRRRRPRCGGGCRNCWPAGRRCLRQNLWRNCVRWCRRYR